MPHTPPVPTGNQSPYPLQAPTPTPSSGTTATTTTPSASSSSSAGDAVASARAAVGPLAEKATSFARARPYATAAVLGTVALALFNTLRGKRP